MRARVNKNRVIIHDRISITGHAIFWRNIIIGHAFARQYYTDGKVAPILV